MGISHAQLEILPAVKQVLATRLAGEPLAKAERKFLRDGNGMVLVRHGAAAH